MPVPTSLATLSQTPGSNSPAGSDTVFPSLDDFLREMFADLARLRDGANSWLTGVSGVDTITASCTSIGALVAGQVFRFVAAGANTGAVTLNINSLGAKAVKRPGAVALVAGDMPTFSEVGYNGTDFELMNPRPGPTTTIAWSGITGRPTTIQGYGVTDGMRLFASGASLPGSDIGPIWHADYGSVMTWQAFTANGASYTGYASAKVGSIFHDAQPTARQGSVKVGSSALSKASGLTVQLWNWALHNNLVVALGSWTAGTLFYADNGDGTYRSPDTRGVVARTFADGSSIDSGRSHGTAQLDALQGHWHSIGESADDDFSGYTNGGGGPGYGVGYGTAKPRARTPITDGTNGTPRIADETRMRNVAMLGVIQL